MYFKMFNNMEYIFNKILSEKEIWKIMYIIIFYVLNMY